MRRKELETRLKRAEEALQNARRRLSALEVRVSEVHAQLLTHDDTAVLVEANPLAQRPTRIGKMLYVYRHQTPQGETIEEHRHANESRTTYLVFPKYQNTLADVRKDDEGLIR